MDICDREDLSRDDFIKLFSTGLGDKSEKSELKKQYKALAKKGKVSVNALLEMSYGNEINEMEKTVKKVIKKSSRGEDTNMDKVLRSIFLNRLIDTSIKLVKKMEKERDDTL